MATNPMPVPMSEAWLADQFASRYGHLLKFVKVWRRWYIRVGNGWREDAKNEHCNLAIVTLIAACAWPEAADLTLQQRRTLCSRKAAWSMLALAGTDPRIAATSEEVGVAAPVRWQRKKLDRKPKPRP